MEMNERILTKYYALADKFRKAIDEASSNNELKMHPFNKFPDDCCDLTCELLSRYLLEYGIKTVHVNGVHRFDSQWHHVWIQTLDGMVVDITGDQFNRLPNMPSDIPAVYVGEEGIIHKMFCDNKEVENPTDFTEHIYDSLGIPNVSKQVLNDAYNIIMNYL